MHLRDSNLKVSHADPVVVSTGTGNLLGSIIHCVELSNFVAITNFLEKCLYLVACSERPEVIFVDARLRIVRREEQIDCLGLITIVLQNNLSWKGRQPLHTECCWTV